MKSIFAAGILIFLSFTLSAQHTVVKKWDARFGGVDLDDLHAISNSKDGGYLLGGESQSDIGGDRTQASQGGGDYWIVKIDEGGNYQWDKRYGGSGGELLNIIQPTNDGGYILGGFTGSGNSGDVTEPSRGGYDYWIVKIDSLGTKQWDKRFGGSGDDILHNVKQTKDGGYILTGGSSSGINGDKTQDNRGIIDYWVVKTDSVGNKLWDRRFGGSEQDNSLDIIQTPDLGYLIGGLSLSDSSGDKTHANFGSVACNFWVIKIDPIGTKQWDKVFGGSNTEYLYSMAISSDSNYILAGDSYSDSSGNKSSGKCGYWVVEIDTSGNKLGDWVFGTGIGSGTGTCAETFKSMSKTLDGGYLLTGTSGPYVGGDKTSANLGDDQIWTIKIDSQMHRVWDKTSLTVGNYDKAAGAIETSSGCYLVGVETNVGAGGEKTQADWGSWDYWVVQYCDTILTAITETAGDIHFTIYPVPTTREVSIHLEQPDLHEATFTLTSPTGQRIYQSTEDNLASSYTKILDLGTLPAGIYLLDVSVGTQHITRKIVKE